MSWAPAVPATLQLHTSALIAGSAPCRTWLTACSRVVFPINCMVCQPHTAAALKGNESLRTLELSYNPIGADGAKAFADVVKYDMQES